MDHHIKSFYGKLSHLHTCQFLFPLVGVWHFQQIPHFCKCNQSKLQVRMKENNYLYHVFPIYIYLQSQNFKFPACKTENQNRISKVDRSTCHEILVQWQAQWTVTQEVRVQTPVEAKRSPFFTNLSKKAGNLKCYDCK